VVVVSDGFAPIRSYQRIFRPDRRIYQVDGRRLPVPGGVPLGWLAWAFGSVLVVLAVSGRSLMLSGLVAVAAAGVGSFRSWRAAVAWGCVALVLMQAAGLLLGWVDWPLRLLVLPAAVATGACQVSADGRPPHRYLACYVLWRLRAARWSLERPLAAPGEVGVWAPRVWIAPDFQGAVLAHGRVHGPARLDFAEEVVLTRSRGRHVVRPAAAHRARPGDVLTRAVELLEGQVVEVRP
jgi:hypothetical protein